MKPYTKKLFGKYFWYCTCRYCGNPKKDRMAHKKSARQLSKKEIRKELNER